MLNIAIAGFGWWGRHILTRLQGHDRLSVLAVAEPDQSLHADIRAMGAEAVSGFDGVLSDPRVQAVVLTTPHMMHEEQVVAAARAGKHVFCEMLVYDLNTGSLIYDSIIVYTYDQ